MQKEDNSFSRLFRRNNLNIEKLFVARRDALVRFAIRFVFEPAIAEDIVQGVFVYLLENANKIDLKKSVETYLFGAVKNACLNHLRDLKIKDKHQLLYIEAVLKLSEENIDFEEETIKEIAGIIKTLPPRMYEIIYRKYFLEMSVKEIATDLSISENTVKVQLFKGRVAIRQLLEPITS